MADEIKVKPTPIQRNPLDVATELTLFYYEKTGVDSVEELQETFIKFHAVATAVDKLSPKYCSQYLPKDLADAVEAVYGR